MNGKSRAVGTGHQLEQHRLELVNLNRILSLLPKPVLPSQENSYVDHEADNHHGDTWGEGVRLQYPAVQKIPDDNELANPPDYYSFLFSHSCCTLS